MTVKVGDKLDVWFEGGHVIAVKPYEGRYPQFYTQVVRVSAPRTSRGWMELALPDVAIQGDTK